MQDVIELQRTEAELATAIEALMRIPGSAAQYSKSSRGSADPLGAKLWPMRWLT